MTDIKYPHNFHIKVDTDDANSLAQGIKRFMNNRYGIWPDITRDGFDDDLEVELIVHVYADDDYGEKIAKDLKEHFAIGSGVQTREHII